MSEPRLSDEAHAVVLSIIRQRGDHLAKGNGFVVADLWAIADAVATIESDRGRKEEREKDKYKAMAEYIAFLEEDIRRNAGFLDVHGIKTDQAVIDKGEALRRRITERTEL